MNIRLLLSIVRLLLNTKKSRRAMLRLREKKLRRVLRHACKNSPYYKASFAAAGITMSNIRTIPLKRLPALEKETLLSDFDSIVTKRGVTQSFLRSLDESGASAPRGVHFVHSSGTTGTPRYVFYDEAAWRTMLAGIIRGAFWGMGFGALLRFLRQGVRLCYIAAVNGNYGGAVSIRGGAHDMGAEELFIDLNAPVAEWLPAIHAFRPNLLIGYPSALKILAEETEREQRNADFSEVRQVVTCGEPLPPTLRAYMERVFCKKVINFYGTSESLALGLEESKDSGMLLFDDLNYIEEIDGAMYLTCLYNFAQPLIRYRISDKIRLLDEERGPFSRCAVVQSREEDIMWFTDGARREFLHPLSVEGFCIDGLVDYQFVQTDDSAFSVQIQTAPDIGGTGQRRICDDLARQIQRVLDEKSLGFVRFSIERVDEILPEQNGKKKLVVRCA